MLKPYWTSLMEETDKIFATFGYEAVKKYIEEIGNRQPIGIDEDKIIEAKVYRDQLIKYYKSRI